MSNKRTTSEIIAKINLLLDEDMRAILTNHAERIESESGGICVNTKATRTEKRTTLYITVEIMEA